MADISKILIPALDGSPGGIYNIKDTVAREMLAGGINYFIAWNGQSVPNVANIPNTVSVRYNDTVYTGTLDPANAAPMTLYLVYNGDNGANNFTEYAAATDDQNIKFWEALGETGAEMSNLGALAYMDSIDLDKGQGVNVIGENATLQASSSNVTFGTHTTANVLGTNTTFDVTDATYTLTPTKGNVTLTRSTNVAITPSTTSVLSALDTTNSAKETVLKSSTTFTKKKIATATVRGVQDTNESVAVDFTGSTKRKLITDTVIPAKSKTILGSDLVSAVKSKLETTQIHTVNYNGVTAVTGIEKTFGTLDTGTINKVEAITTNNAQNNEWKDTVANLDIHMYSSVTDGSSGVFANADNETLVISFKTLPSLKIASANETYAKGNFTGNSGAATVLADIRTTTNSNIAERSGTSTTVATGSLNGSDKVGSIILTGIDSQSVTVAEVDTAKRFATGDIASTNTENNNEQYGDEVYTAISGSVSVPKKATNATDVLVPTLQNATSSTSDVNVITNVSTETESVYKTVAFEQSTVLNGVGTITQPVFTASVTADNNGSVLTGASISKSAAGSVTVASGNTPVTAITALGTATAAAQNISFSNKDLKKVPLYDDLQINTAIAPFRRYLNFIIPEGGNIILYKNNALSNPDFEYSLDGVNWTTWNANSGGDRFLQIASNERVYLRNKSETPTGLCYSASNGFYFTLPAGVIVNGCVESLLCKFPEKVITLSEEGRLMNLFKNNEIKGRPIINHKTTRDYGIYGIFSGCSTLDEVEVHIENYNTNAFTNWLLNVAPQGAIYCPAVLDLPTNSSSGVPAGWTRVDI